MKSGRSHRAAAERVWQRLFALLMASSEARAAALVRHGLTPNDARALWSLSATGRPIGALARAWACDPSNATFIIDRLEKAGLATRVPSPADRRVKLVTLTRKGAATRKALQTDYDQPPPEILALDEADLATLEDVLLRMASAGGDD
jgi:DNA-binding MarR family transcriptional regulator